MDFAKAFDKVPHRRLADKCKAHGIDGQVIDWINAWLKDRWQRVVLNGSSSTWRRVFSGVPQGSVLGPTLFLIYINDIDDAIDTTTSVIKKFADDTKVVRVVETEEDRDAFQAGIKGLEEWSKEWQMLFNVGKCHILHVGHNNPMFKYNMDGKEMVEEQQEKDVGVMIATNLKPSAQCLKAAKKANQVLGQLARAVTYRGRTFVRLYTIYV